MNCFDHPGVPAVGVCNHCMRGLCRECAVETEGLLACRGRCEAIVDELADSRRMVRKMPALQQQVVRIRRLQMRIAGAATFVVGALFAYYSLKNHEPLATLYILVAALGLGFFGRSFRRALFGIRACRICNYNLAQVREPRCPNCDARVQPNAPRHGSIAAQSAESARQTGES